jgi:thiol-disulfide isomerase/thioredoxin
MTSRRPWKAGAAAVLALLLSGALPSRSMAGEGELRPLLSAGEKAPGFSLRDVDGNEVLFRPGDGKPALVVFWSVFCPTCRELMPGIDGFAARHGATVRVVGVNLDGSRFAGAVRDYLRETALRFPVGLDALRGDFFIASDPYGVEKTPTVVLLGRDGTVRGAWAAGKIREFLSESDSIVAALQQGASPGQ